MRQRVRAAVLAITCFALGAVFQRFYDARRPVTPQPPQAVNSSGTDIRIAEERPASRPRRSDSIASRCGRTASRRRPNPATKRPAGAAQPEPSAQPGSGRADEAQASRGKQRDLLARRRPRWSERDRLVSRRSPADARRHRARSRPAGQPDARLRLVSPAEREGASGKRRAGGPPGHLRHAPDRRLSQRPAVHRRSAKTEHQHDDRTGEGDDRRRGEGRRRSTSHR